MNEIYQSLLRLFRSRKQAYEFTFKNNKDADLVLKDLAKFCRAKETTFHADPRVHAVIEGRREVFLRIQNYLNLTTEELVDLYRKDSNHE